MRFLLLSDTRSGTMMLTDTLSAAYPQIRWFNLYAVNPDNPTGSFMLWLKHLWEVEAGVTHRGTTMHRVGEGWMKMLSPLGPEEFWRTVYHQHDRWVLLHRENLLRRFLSTKVGVILRTYKVDQPRRQDPGPVRVPIQELMEFIGESLLRRQSIDVYFPGRLAVTYEELLSRWSETFYRVQEYLGLPPCEAEPVTVRQETRPLHLAVENYEEIESYLTNRGYTHWLLDQGVD